MFHVSEKDTKQAETDRYMFCVQPDPDATARYVQNEWAKCFKDGSGREDGELPRGYSIDTRYPPCNHKWGGAPVLGCDCYREHYKPDRIVIPKPTAPVLRGRFVGDWEKQPEGGCYDLSILPPPGDAECMDEKSFMNERTYGFGSEFGGNSDRSGPRYERYEEAWKRLKEDFWKHAEEDEAV